VSFYAQRILPGILDMVMRNKEATRYRSAIVSAAAGRVLEIGAGSGLNLPFYGSTVSRLHALDSSPAMLQMARERHSAARFPIEFIEASAEEIPLASRSIDTVVTTWSLCTIPDAAKALREARRVLAPGGTLLFVEHGLAPDPSVARWQRQLDPLWRRVAGGCHLDRRIDRMIGESGFRIVEMESAYARGPRPFTYMYSGRARAA
jgi:ubiquinone/menaquinone biosynthesis C-methylase UbiE